MRLFFLAFMACSLLGCGAVANLADMQAHAAAVTAALDRQFGTKPEVSWNVFNGQLQTVSVVSTSTRSRARTSPTSKQKCGPS